MARARRRSRAPAGSGRARERDSDRDALRDWQAHFPRDPWIPKYAYALAELYGKLDMDDAQTRKDETLDWLAASYPQSEYALQSR